MKRRIVVSLVFILAIALCAGLVWFNFFRDKMIKDFFATMKQPPQVVTAAKAEVKTWTPSIGAIGTAKAANGVELAVHTREHYPHVKIILASGYPLPALKLDKASLQDFVFVNKPYRLSDLARALRMAG